MAYRSNSYLVNRRIRGPYSKPKMTARESCFKIGILDAAVKSIEEEQSKNNGKLPYGYMRNLLQDLKRNPCLADANRHTIYNHIQQKKELERSKREAEDSQRAAIVSPMNVPEEEEDATNAARPAGGRPKGSTKAQKAKQEADYEAAVEWASVQLRDKQWAANGTNLANGVLKDIIIEATAKFGVTHKEITAESIRSRVKRNNVHGRAKSMMHDIEPMLVDLCIQCDWMGQPLDQPGFLELANSMIDGTPLYDDIQAWKKNCGFPGPLGVRYYK